MSEPARAKWGWPLVGALLAALLTYATTASSLALSGYLGALQIGFLVGVVAGLIAPSLWVAVGAAGAALAIGVVVVPPWFYQGQPLTLVVLFVVAMGVAAGARAVVDSGQLRESVIVALALVVVTGSMLLVASSVVVLPNKGYQGRSILQEISLRPVAGEGWSDGQFYRAVVWKMREGQSFYDAFRAAHRENGRWLRDPVSVLGVRPPLLFELWKSLPGWPGSALWSLLVLGGVAMLCAPIAVARTLKPAAAIAGAAGLGAYVLGYALTPSLLFLSEIWTGLLGVLVIAAFALSQREEAGKVWMVTAAGIALLAAVTRELMVFMLLAGLLASWFGPRSLRRFNTTVWGVALAVFAGLWAVHLSIARRIVTPVASVAFVWFQHGGLQNLLSGIVSSTSMIGDVWLPIALTVLGVAGALAQKDKQFRIFAVAVVCLPLVGFLFAGTDAAVKEAGGTSSAYNYWGGIVMPAVIVMAPAALAWIPGMRASVAVPTGEDTEVTRA